MNPNLFFSLVIPFFLRLVWVSVTVLADHLDMYCEVSSCGDITNIRYPFWLSGKQPSYCGFPAFELQCKDDIPLIVMPSGEYQVKKIFYDNSSLVVADHELVGSECPVLYRNLSFSVTPFTVNTSVNRELYYFYNCSDVGPEYFKVGCASAVNGVIPLVYLGGDYGSPESITHTCSAYAYMPALRYPGADSSQYRNLIRNGFILDWTVADCKQCTDSNGQCGYSYETRNFICICADRLHWQSCAGEMKKSRMTTVAATLGGSAAFIAVCCFVCCWYIRRRRKQRQYLSELVHGNLNISDMRKNNLNTAQNVEAFLQKYASLVPRRYKYSDVKKITESFHNRLGQGGYGSVFKGSLGNGCLVAVKVLNNSKGNGEDFVNEIASIGRSSHVNIVNLLGFCSEGSKRALIYEYMCNGSLDKLICSEEPKTTADWEKLYRIAIGIARGLEYLHRGCNTRIVHFDIKPHNILLDEDFCPKISDFGLAKLCIRKDSILSMEDTRGTIGYIAPEVFSRNFGVVSSKSDIYSYGMMVLEMAGGRKNVTLSVQNTSETYFPHSIYKHMERNSDLQAYGVTAETEEVVRKLILVGLWCIQTLPQNRPSITRVIEMLEGSITDLQLPPRPNLSFPSPLRSLSDNSSTQDGTCSGCSASAIH